MSPYAERLVTIYTFIPLVVYNPGNSKVYGRVRERFIRLRRRHEKSSALIGSTLFSDTETIDFMQEAKIDVEDWFREGDLASRFQMGHETSFAAHLAIFEEYRAHAEQLSEPLHGSRVTTRFDAPRVVVLFELDGTLHLILFSPTTNQIEQKDEREILDLIRCNPDEPLAFVRFSEIEEASLNGVDVWGQQKGIDTSRAKKICALYLQPLSSVPAPGYLL